VMLAITLHLLLLLPCRTSPSSTSSTVASSLRRWQGSTTGGCCLAQRWTPCSRVCRLQGSAPAAAAGRAILSSRCSGCVI
jgi:hypothetical protein